MTFFQRYRTLFATEGGRRQRNFGYVSAVNIGIALATNSVSSYFDPTVNQVASCSFDQNTLFNLDNGSRNTVFSLSFWMKSSGTLPNFYDIAGNEADKPFFSIGQENAAAGSKDLAFRFVPRAGVSEQLFFEWMQPTDDNQNSTYLNRVVITATPSTRFWHHWLLVYDGANTKIEIYCDGIRVAGPTATSGTISNAIHSSSLPFYIGGNGSAGQGNNIWIDEFGVYDTALTASHAIAHFNKGTPVNLTTSTGNSNLKAFWRFGDGNDNIPIIYDVTNNGNDLIYLNPDSPNLSGTLEASFTSGTTPIDPTNDKTMSFIPDGINDSFNVIHESYNTITNGWTYSIWASASNYLNTRTFVDKGSSAGPIYAYGASGIFQASVDSGVNTWTTPSGGWHNLTVRYDGTLSTDAEKLSFWIDGIEQTAASTNPIPSTVSANSDILAFFARSDGALEGNAAGHQIALWNSALSNTTISDLYNSGSVKDWREYNPQYYFLGSSFGPTTTKIINYGQGSNATPVGGIIASGTSP